MMMIKSKMVLTFWILVIVLALLFLINYQPVEAVGENWWNDSFEYRRPITVTVSNGMTLTDYQVFVNITNTTNMNANGNDMRFISNDNSTKLDYWIEEDYVASDYFPTWVEVDTLNTTIWLYYNSTDADAESNGTNTFYFFDDFEDESVDWAGKWYSGDQSHYSETDEGWLELTAVTPNWAEQIFTDDSYSNYTVMARVLSNDTGNNAMNMQFAQTQGTNDNDDNIDWVGTTRLRFRLNDVNSDETAQTDWVRARGSFHSTGTATLSVWDNEGNLIDAVTNTPESTTDYPSMVSFTGGPSYVDWFFISKYNSTTDPVAVVGDQESYSEQAADENPVSSLVTPEDESEDVDGSIIFNCSVTDDQDINNITLWHNGTGTWHANSTNTSVDGTWDFAEFTVDFGAVDQEIMWNCIATDNASQTDWGNSNYTVYVDTTPMASITVNKRPMSPSVTLYPYLNVTLDITSWINYTLDGGSTVEGCHSCAAYEWNVSVSDGEHSILVETEENSEYINWTTNTSMDIGWTWNVPEIIPSASGFGPGRLLYFDDDAEALVFTMGDNVDTLRAAKITMNGTLLWDTGNITTGGAETYMSRYWDIDDDGVKEIIAHIRTESDIYIIDGNNGSYTSIETVPGVIWDYLNIGNVSGDGWMIIAGSGGPSGGDENMTVFWPNGTVYCSLTEYVGSQPVVAYDMDNDGKDEWVTCNSRTDCTLHVWEDNCTLKWDEYAGPSHIDSVKIADVNVTNDGLELIHVSDNQADLVVRDAATGTELNRVENVFGEIQHIATTNELDSNRYDIIACDKTNPGTCKLFYGGNLTQVWSYTAPGSGGNGIIPWVLDYDGDGVMEIVSFQAQSIAINMNGTLKHNFVTEYSDADNQDLFMDDQYGLVDGNNEPTGMHVNGIDFWPGPDHYGDQFLWTNNLADFSNYPTGEDLKYYMSEWTTDTTDPTLTFVSPTQANQTEENVTWFYVNVSSDETLDVCYLDVYPEVVQNMGHLTLQTYSTDEFNLEFNGTHYNYDHEHVEVDNDQAAYFYYNFSSMGITSNITNATWYIFAANDTEDFEKTDIELAFYYNKAYNIWNNVFESPDYCFSNKEECWNYRENATSFGQNVTVGVTYPYKKRFGVDVTDLVNEELVSNGGDGGLLLIIHSTDTNSTAIGIAGDDVLEEDGSDALTFMNWTQNAFENITMTVSGTTANYNSSLTLLPSNSTEYYFRVYCNDSSGNWGVTEDRAWTYAVQAAGGESGNLTCDSCLECSQYIKNSSAGTTIELSQDITDTDDGVCVDFGGNDGITFDCKGYSVIGDYDALGDGIEVHGSDNSTIQGCTIKGFQLGIQSTASNQSNNLTVYNTTIRDNIGTNLVIGCNDTNISHVTLYNSTSGGGLTIQGGSNIIDNVNASYNSDYGIYLINAHYNTISACTMINNGDDNLMVGASYNNIITNSTFRDATGNDFNIAIPSSNTNVTHNDIQGGNGIYVLATGCYIYNNDINATGNSISGDYSNDWNMTKTNGTNILGLSGYGGNYWAGYTGVDRDGDGIGDTSYTLATGNIDYHPLVNPDYSTVTAKTPDQDQDWSFSGVAADEELLEINFSSTANVNQTLYFSLNEDLANTSVIIINSTTNLSLDDQEYITLNLTINATCPAGSYSGNLTWTSQNDSGQTGNITISFTIDSQSANMDITNSTWSAAFTSGSSVSRYFEVNNTGDYNATNCNMSYSGSVGSASFDQSSFTVENGTAVQVKATFSGSSTGTDSSARVDVSCTATALGGTDTDQVTGSISISAASDPGGGGGSGGGSTVVCGDYLALPEGGFSGTALPGSRIRSFYLRIDNGNISQTFDAELSEELVDYCELEEFSGEETPAYGFESLKVTCIAPEAEVTGHLLFTTDTDCEDSRPITISPGSGLDLLANLISGAATGKTTEELTDQDWLIIYIVLFIIAVIILLAIFGR